MSRVENRFVLLISRRLSIQPYLSRLPSFPRLTRRNAFACCFCSLPANATKSPNTSSTRRAAAFPGTKYPSNHHSSLFQVSLYLQRCLTNTPECETPRVIHVPPDRGVSLPRPSLPPDRIHHSFSYLPTEQFAEPLPRFHLSTDHLSFPLSSSLRYPYGNETPAHRIPGRRSSRTESPPGMPARFRRSSRADSDRIRSEYDSYGREIPAGESRK